MELCGKKELFVKKSPARKGGSINGPPTGQARSVI
jgi:hypothetical protein